MNRRALRFGAVIAVTALTTLAFAPAFAATTISQATARALNLTIAGNSVTDGLGRVEATNDGTGETKTGPTDPPISVLLSQGLLNVGALVQQAEATVAGNGDGNSAACSGVAGEGATGSLANVGDSSCIDPGRPVDISLANLDLSNVELIDPASALGPLAALNVPLATILGAITAPLSDALQSALGTVSIGGSLGAIESQCTANPYTASGTTHLVNTTGDDNNTPITLTAAGQSIVIASLPVNPAVNEPVITDLSGVTGSIITGVNQELHDALTAAGSNVASPLYPLSQLTTALQDQVITALTTALDPVLQPIEENILNITLNKQVSSSAGKKIDVTAIDLQLLPVAQSQLGFSAVSADIANVTCGPNDRVTTTTPDNPTTTPGDNTPTPGGDIPTSVDSGLAGGHTPMAVLLATGALMLLAGAGGLMRYRRILQR